MPNRPEDKKRILTRVRRIKGQCEALERALEEGAPCGGILQQIAAVRGGMNGLMAEVLEAHIRDEFGGERADAHEKIQDLMALVRSYLK
ncbi:metal/formaldehyde-sensitive transcriptional repressor [Nitratireductor basaltis]|uniref:Regulator protein FrmR n=1 Tax=Nitratireductor basaltis TaxID=472175 RepID=A0A084U518_9HYPH|nr:metal/formaldehyde-sensitive transcriptional repressor [Nitratireductor basaltis]KFB08054.1 hypothetical protein EL18_03264 [Nitratireductor basaltis]